LPSTNDGATNSMAALNIDVMGEVIEIIEI
jgi:hypothetical protein